ncbi:type VI secretion system tube protein Hcp [Haloarchaeobius sp. HME9146]|uniref:Hcp family type VI secretion system effector n=1 Tax=Haloarchaeobius sp. HME9146 TaxID=2978732 RepID=UPI0021C0E9AE|nr:type VI secretion system tube protein Hcp [Haloarchaeobius sp. HME9146]MCT9095516.1 type VI secretion system tube protein Hcp [Haloarchaeobius sp. HME9146]
MDSRQTSRRAFVRGIGALAALAAVGGSIPAAAWAQEQDDDESRVRTGRPTTGRRGGRLRGSQPTQPAAAGAYLKFDDIEGESTDRKHRGEIDIESWSWGVASEEGRVARRGRVQHRPLTITKRVDKATPKLTKAATSGRNLGEVVLTVELGGRTMTMTMRNVRVVASSLSFDSETGWPMETLELEYDGLTMAVDRVEADVE